MIIELLFAKIYFIYKKFGENDLKLFYSCTITSILVGFNFISVILLIDSLVKKITFIQTDYWIVLIGLTSLIVTYLYLFPTGKAKKIIQDHQGFSRKQNFAVYTFVIFTIVFSITIGYLKKYNII